MFRKILLAMMCVVGWASGHARAEVRSERDFVLIDGVKISFGQVIEVIGPSPHDYSSSDSGKGSRIAQIQGLRINGKGNLDQLFFNLTSSPKDIEPYFEKIPDLKKGTYYKVRGHLTRAWFGGEDQGCRIVVDRVQVVNAAPLLLTEFVDRAVKYEGLAIANGQVQVEHEKIRLQDLTAWPSSAAGKKISVAGTLRRDGSGWRIDKPRWELVNLADQLNTTVSLEGSLSHDHQRWWFNSREPGIYLTSASGQLMKFEDGDQYRQVRVTGKLLRQLRPPLFSHFEGSAAPLVPTFVIRGAIVEFAKQDVSWSEKSTWLDPSVYKFRDGVPELFAERDPFIHPMVQRAITETNEDRNRTILKNVLIDLNPKTQEIVAARLNDRQLPEHVRIMYATLLARVNDDRGRKFLQQTIERRRPDSIGDALQWVGWIPRFLPQQVAVKADLRWVEKTLLDVMNDQRLIKGGPRPKFRFDGSDDRPQTFADLAVDHEIPQLLLALNPSAARKTLVNYVLTKSRLASTVVSTLCNSDTLVPVEDLLRMEAVSEKGGRPILIQLLRHKHPAAAHLFFRQLGNSGVYGEFREHLSPEVVAALRTHSGDVQGKTWVYLQMLLIVSGKDPGARLVSLLDQPKWGDKNFALYELARLKEPRAVAPILRILREAPAEFFNNSGDSESTIAVEHALEAIANAGTRESTAALINLLDVDLSRFGTYLNRIQLQRVVAGHLIDTTGESFGVDAKAWREWHQSKTKD